MKIVDWIKGLFKSRDKPKDEYRWSGSPFLFGSSLGGKSVDTTTALQLSVVFACVKILAESIACLPLHVYETDGKGNKSLATSHPLYFLLHDAPNSEMSAYNFKETTVLHLVLQGNSYSQIARDNKGKITGLFPLLPDRMTVKRADSGERIYTYMPNKGENDHFTKTAKAEFKERDILHIPALSFDGLYGYSPIAMAKNAIGVAIACEEFGAKFFENDARPAGILKHPGTIKNPDKLRDSWQTAFSGVNHGKTAVLEEGVQYETISIPPDDAQFLDTRKFQIAEIARIYRIPLHLLNELDRATFNNISQMSLEFVTYTLTPWLVRLEQNFNRALFKQEERGRYFTKFSVEGFLRGDYETRTNGYQKAIQSGWLNVNEVRGLEDMNRIPAEEGGDTYMINGNMAKLRDCGAAYAKKAGDNNE